MSTLSELLPAGGGGSTVDFVASGTLPNGKPVILKADGTVEVVAGVGFVESVPAATAVVFNSTGNSYYCSISFDPTNANKFVIAYKDVSYGNRGTAIIGTVSGTSLSFGAEYVFEWNNTAEIVVKFIPNMANKFLIVFHHSGNSRRGQGIIGTVSGTSISYGTLSQMSTDNNYYDFDMDFDPSITGRCVVIFRYQDGNQRGQSKIGTVSGTSISWSSEVSFKGSYAYYGKVKYISTNKFLVAYRNQTSQQANATGMARVGTVSGTSVTYHTDTTFYSGLTNWIGLDVDVSGSAVLSYRDDVSSAYTGNVLIANVSGTNNITFGAPTQFHGPMYYGTVSCDPNNAGKFVIGYSDNATNDAIVVIGSFSGTTITMGTKHTIDSYGEYYGIDFDPNNSGKFIVAYSNSAGKAIVGQLSAANTNLTTTNFVGTSTAAYTNGQTATIAVQGGLSTNQTGLTIGSTYFVQPTGTLATTAGTPSVNAGKALSATTLLLKDL